MGSYPRPSKEPLLRSSNVCVTGQLSLKDLVSVVEHSNATRSRPAKILTAYGVEKGGWDAFEARAAWTSLAILAAMTAALFVSWLSFGWSAPTLRGLSLVLYVIPWVIGLYAAGRRRLTKLGWLVAMAIMGGLTAFGLFVFPALAEWVNTTLTGWILGPDVLDESSSLNGIIG